MLRRTIAAALLIMGTCYIAAHAQEPKYPNRPIKLVVGYSPGGSNDVVARIIAKRFEESLGQAVVVENKPSTAAIAGAVSVAKAPADGYTLMIGASGPIVINPAVYGRLPYSPQRDFVPVSMIATFPLILSVKKDAPIATVADLVHYTKTNPGRSNYASSSSTFQLATELLKERTGLVAQHIPYKGSSDSMHSVAAGETTFSLLDPGPAAGAINGNLLRGLAVTAEKRMAAYPDIPTLKEQGIDLQTTFWIGLFAPAGTPAGIVQLLSGETARAVANEETARRMQKLGLIPKVSSSSEFKQRIDDEITSWSALASQKNIRAD